MVDSEIKCDWIQSLTAKIKDFCAIACAGSNPAPPTKQNRYHGDIAQLVEQEKQRLVKAPCSKLLGLLSPLSPVRFRLSPLFHLTVT